MAGRLWNFRARTDPSWWHWALTVPLLAAHLAGVADAIYLAIALCAVMAAWYLLKFRQLRPYPVQVRLAYLALLLIGTVPYMGWIYWVQLIGTSAMVLVGYCPLIRMLALAPWNRSEPFSLRLVKHVIVASRSGGLLDGQRAPALAFAGDAALVGGCHASHGPAELGSCSLAFGCSPRSDA